MAQVFCIFLVFMHVTRHFVIFVFVLLILLIISSGRETFTAANIPVSGHQHGMIRNWFTMIFLEGYLPYICRCQFCYYHLSEKKMYYPCCRGFLFSISKSNLSRRDEGEPLGPRLENTFGWTNHCFLKELPAGVNVYFNLISHCFSVPADA